MLSKKSTVYLNIKERIIIGDLAPGFPVKENELARELNTSKTPIHEALLQLEREELIENVPGRGSTVPHITVQGIRETLELREIIECGVVKRSALACNMQELRNHKEKMQKLTARDIELDCSSWEIREEIHLYIVTCGGNQKLLNIYLNLMDHIRRICIHYIGSLTLDRASAVLTEHIAIIDALIERNPERAEMAVQNHLHNNAINILRLVSP